MLLRAGAISRRGLVEQGTTVGDHDPEEIARGTTLTIALASFAWTDDGAERALTLIDTPGHPDFVGGVDTALAVADAAAIVVSAVDGVTAGTRAAWAAAEQAGVPRVVVVTQEDRARADFRRVLAELQAEFGEHVWPLELPLGEEQGFHADRRCAGRARAGLRHRTVAITTSRLPSEAEDEEHTLHRDVTEEIVSHDDAQLEAYLDGTEPTAADLERTLAHEVATGETVPVVLCSGLTGTGVDRVLDLLWGLAPDPLTRDTKILVGGDGGSEHAVSPNPDGEVLVHVFRTVADPFVGQIAMLKVLSGVLRPSDRLYNATTGAEERMPALFRLRGAEHLPVDALRTGEVGAVAKLGGSPSASLLWSRPQGAARPASLPERHPVYAVSLTPASQSDDAKLSTALARLVAEDHTLVIDRIGGDTILRGLGDTHVAVAIERMARVLGVHVTSAPAPVAYRETIAKPAQAEGRLKKQSGGHGQFAVVQLRVEPLPAGDRIRVRRRGRRRLGSPQLHPRGGEGRARRAGLRRAAGPSGRRRAGGAVRRQVALRRLLRDGVPHGGFPRGQGGSGRGGHRAARTGIGGDDHRARRPAGPGSHRPVVPARARTGDRIGGRWSHPHHRPRARGRARPLRAGPSRRSPAARAS